MKRNVFIDCWVHQFKLRFIQVLHIHLEIIIIMRMKNFFGRNFFIRATGHHFSEQFSLSWAHFWFLLEKKAYIGEVSPSTLFFCAISLTERKIHLETNKKYVQTFCKWLKMSISATLFPISNNLPFGSKIKQFHSLKKVIKALITDYLIYLIFGVVDAHTHKMVRDFFMRHSKR